MWSLRGDYDGAAGFVADAGVAVGQLRIKIQGITGVQDFLLRADLEGKLSFQHINEFHTGVLVHMDISRVNGAEIGKIGVEFPVGGQKIERLEIKSGLFDFGCFGKTQAVLFSHQGEGMFLPLVAEEIVQANAEDERDARKSGDSGV